MVGEVTAKVVGEVAKETAKETAKEVGKQAGKQAVDITKRIDVSAKAADSKASGVDITKRITPEKSANTERIGKELSQKQKDDLVNKGFSKGSLSDCTFKDGVVNLKTKCEQYEGKTYPETGVKCERKTVDLKGTKIEGVFPKFDAVFSAKLPDNLLLASDSKQFVECSKQLNKAIEANPALKKKFNPEQLKMISDGKVPRGYVWNHNEDLGKMELVKREKHDPIPHTGGKAIWGGGSAYR